MDNRIIEGLLRKIDSLERRLGVLEAGEIGGAWIDLTYVTGWSDYSASFAGARYKRVGDIIYLDGLVKRASGTNQNIAQVPFAPALKTILSTINNGAACRIDIQTTGYIYWSSGNNIATWTSLSGLFFPLN